MVSKSSNQYAALYPYRPRTRVIVDISSFSILIGSIVILAFYGFRKTCCGDSDFVDLFLLCGLARPASLHASLPSDITRALVPTSIDRSVPIGIRFVGTLRTLRMDGRTT
eukprot:SAG11_NODE_1738_length_4341_cov_3.274806_6_plen_110_part_00